MSKVIITRDDLKRPIRTKIHDLYCETYGQDVDIETLKITIESEVDPVCLQCRHYDGDDGDSIGNFCLIDSDVENGPLSTCEDFKSGVINPIIRCTIEI